MNNPVRATWCLSCNFGDNLTPFIIKAITGQYPYWLEIGDTRQKVAAVGSTLGWYDGNCDIWGCGIGSLEEHIKLDAKIHSVRGPISKGRADFCGVPCPDIYGDPALLLPKLFKPYIRDRAMLGIVPHYIEQEEVCTGISELINDMNTDLKYINVFGPVDQVVSEIVSCDYIISSSLHGLVVAEAYGIPTKWLKVSGKINDAKFMDHYAAIGYPGEKPVLWEEFKALSNLDMVKLTTKKRIDLDLEKLLKVRPF